MELKDILKTVDHTLLSQTATWEEIKTICDDASKMEIQEIMNEFYRLLEEDIRYEPGEYLWSHKRWKLINKNTK